MDIWIPPTGTRTADAKNILSPEVMTAIAPGCAAAQAQQQFFNNGGTGERLDFSMFGSPITNLTQCCTVDRGKECVNELDDPSYPVDSSLDEMCPSQLCGGFQDP